ncbi:MAG: hypothetical protein DHS20C18_10670 [Saprospiraceae bacterium]|nr:MAG: hypothetical protein DHS20C18_10670 [Saprospiraceae bacterium]
MLSGCQKSGTSLKQTQSDQESQETLFTQLPATVTGVAFRNDIPESSTMNSMVYEYFYNGGGVAVGDIDNDGLPDLYFVANLKENKLYKNKGNFQFEDITQEAGIKGSFGWSTGVTMVDINADGWLDIYVCKSGKGKTKDRENELYLNNKNGTFTEVAAQYGLNFPGYSTQAAFFDFDRDGDLDLFLLNHNTTPINTNHPEKFKLQYDEFAGDKLFRNENGSFTDITKQAGIISNPLGFGLGISVGDLNQDGWPDIYVGNDYIEQDYLYLNNGDGTFTESLKTAIKHTSNFSMGTDIADFNNDGWLDIISLDMVAEDNYGIKTAMSGMNPAAFNHAVQHGFHYQYMYNALQLNNGNHKFSEIAQLAGISNTDWSWAPLFADFDNDGLKDLFVSNGLKRDFRNNDFRKYKLQRLKDAKTRGEKITVVMEELVEKTPQRKTKNYFFKNNGDLTFSKKTEAWGITTASFSNGAVYADLDADGDLDLVVNNIDEEAFIFKNNTTQNHLQLALEGPSKNPFGIGAFVKIKVDNQIQVLENYPTRGYQSAVSTVLHFGLGNAEVIDEIAIVWPDGKQEKLNNIKANQRLKLKYEQAISASPAESGWIPGGLFREVTADVGLYHRHIENEYDDFKKESLLPHKMSQFGPALAVGDVNGDGLQDFFVGGAKGHGGELYFQQKNGAFIPSSFSIWQKEKEYEDVAATFFDADNDGDLDLYVVSGGNEFDADSPFLQDRIYLNDGQKQFIKNERLLPKMLTSGACVKPFDYDLDGDVDLFVGGRLVPGKYAFPAQSYLLQNDGGMFKDVTKEVVSELTKPGMVTDAVWTDFNGDQQTDLIVVGEWMPILFFKNENGKFKREEVLMNQNEGPMNGWWSSITPADLDGDGDMDYVVGNLGLNYKYKASREEPFEVFSNDFDGNGSQDIVLGYYNSGSLYPLRGRECSSTQMPFLKEKFPTYHEFGSAKLDQVYGADKLKESLHLQVSTFASVILENLANEQFKVIRLPNEAQLSSINGSIAEDFDQDGILDVLFAGNLYQSEIETPRNDASVGLYLQGNGQMTFKAIPAFKSGLLLEGDVKKMEPIKLAGKGGQGILVAKNNDQLQLICTAKNEI